MDQILHELVRVPKARLEDNQNHGVCRGEESDQHVYVEACVGGARYRVEDRPEQQTSDDAGALVQYRDQAYPDVCRGVMPGSPPVPAG